VAFGRERTIEQDSTFAFRIIVDIAIKALSPAINDPTTAVIAIDGLQSLLRKVAERKLQDERLFDGDGRLRVVFRTPNWEDFVHLTFSEVRQYGAGNFQVARRLRTMLENALRNVPEPCIPALRLELELLDRAIADLYPFPEDLARARIPDSQGLGGGTEVAGQVHRSDGPAVPASTSLSGSLGRQRRLADEFPPPEPPGRDRI
jgi:hypothetical protein